MGRVRHGWSRHCDLPSPSGNGNETKERKGDDNENHDEPDLDPDSRNDSSSLHRQDPPAAGKGGGGGSTGGTTTTITTNPLAGQAGAKIFVQQEGWYSVSRQNLIDAGWDCGTSATYLQLWAEGTQQSDPGQRGHERDPGPDRHDRVLRDGDRHAVDGHARLLARPGHVPRASNCDYGRSQGKAWVHAVELQFFGEHQSQRVLRARNRERQPGRFLRRHGDFDADHGVDHGHRPGVLDGKRDSHGDSDQAPTGGATTSTSA